jgi:hypothetical protein
MIKRKQEYFTPASHPPENLPVPKRIKWVFVHSVATCTTGLVDAVEARKFAHLTPFDLESGHRIYGRNAGNITHIHSV